MPKIKTRNETNLAIRFIGISLAGGKSDKACLAVIEYYPKEKKVFLSRLFEKIKSDDHVSGDLKIHELIKEHSENLKYVAFDVPLALPECIVCQQTRRLKCPGYEACKEPHIEWMWKHHEEALKKKKTHKLFTPYTQRAVEMYFQTELDQAFYLHHAMGSNAAPLMARALFIKNRLNTECIEVFPKLTFYRLGESLGLLKSTLNDHRAAFGGDESREQLLRILNEKNLAFLYHQDMKAMVDNSHAFEAFMCALTAFFKYQGHTEPRPKKFPANESWVEFPVKDIKF